VCTGQCSLPRLARRRTHRSWDFIEDAAAKNQRSAAQSAGDAWPVPTVSWSHRTVSGAPMGPKVQRSATTDKEGD
jgi:hypothetical protein